MNFAQFGKKKNFALYPELLDIHVDRMITAHSIVQTYMNDSELLRAGAVLLDKFFGDASEEIAAEIMKTKPADKRTPQSQVVNLPGTNSFKAGCKLWDIVGGFFPSHMRPEAKAKFESMMYLQHLVNRPDDNDEQKVFHSDTFFPCLKFWYFPRAVKKDDGAFWYVPYSPRLTDKLIEWHKQRIEDLKADRVEQWRGVGHWEGSLRIGPDEISSLGLRAVPVEVEDDTLVVANVFGFHRRGDTKAETHRLAIHGSIRIDTPFACGAA